VLAPNEAAQTIAAAVAALPAERRELDAALGHVLAADVVSPIDLPPWDNSAMDGYAVRSADVTAPGTVLRIGETIAAGAFPTRALSPGTCARIFTGAPLPQGCDGIIRQEDVTPLEGAARINDLRDVGRNVRPRGEDLRRGTVAVASGTALGPAQLGVLASIAEREVLVHRRPRVAIMTSGDEIVDLTERDAVLSGKKIASSNSYALRALVRQAGGEPLDVGIARDDPADVRAKLAAATGADLIVTSAGVSVGEHDYVRSVLESMGAELTFWRVGMRPGGTTGFGRLSGKPWIGLPGNPVSTMVVFELLARPAIRKMLGHTLLFRRPVAVRLDEPARSGLGLRHYLRAIVRDEADGRHARLTGPQGSGILTSMAKANALLIVPEDKSEVAAGTTLSAILLDETVHLSEPAY
jgi:molybdopterin molybdotransferase